MAVPATPETITGRVVSVNPKGVKFDGHVDWFNLSQFARNIVPPMRGQHVTLTLDRQGFVRECTAGVTAKTDETPDVDRAYGAPPTAKTDETRGARDRTLTRLAVLKAAAEFAASRPQLKSGEVLKIAASWELWVNRPESAEEAIDAF
ncbi:MAG TPA: hypothetical protein VFH48_18655 [Chloroflexota bacterium]|nr:hypothetical protein [Chloroflexota bacterium]